ncbi:Protein SRT-61 [Aphelenchoides avenae]|nr:Protein SRT-61 [Aphelenchus avenae]
MVLAEDILAGVLIVILASFFLYLNISVTWAIFAEKDMRRLSSYKFIIIVGLLDGVQLVIHDLGGIFLVAQNAFHPLFNKVLGALLDGCFVSYSVFTLMLAVNRIMLVVSPNLAERVFSGVVLVIWYAIGLAVLAAVTVLLITDKVSSTFNVQMWRWEYNYDLELTAWYSDTQMLISLTSFAISGCFYLVIFWVVLYRRVRLGREVSRSELNILLQASMITLYIGGHQLIWNFYEALQINTRQGYYIMELLWMGNCAVNPVMALCLNKTIRRKLMIPFIKRQTTKAIQVIHTVTAVHRGAQVFIQVSPRDSSR